MKSKKAEKYLDSRAKYANEFLSSAEEIGRIVVPIMSAVHAVEIAEREMIEKAAKVFSEHCEMYAGGCKCLEGGECCTCDRVKKFKQKLMEE